MAKKETKRSKDPKAKADSEVNELVAKAQVALQKYMLLDQVQVNDIIKEMALAGLEHHYMLAQLAVEETQRGILEDKAIKNMFATEYIYHSIKYDKTVGIVYENEEEDYVIIAEPVGVIAGITPSDEPNIDDHV